MNVGSMDPFYPDIFYRHYINGVIIVTTVEIICNFKEQIENVKPHVMEDMVVVLNLYEASYHSFEDESILDEVRVFTTKYLKENVGYMNGAISALVSHALEFPLQWRVPRVEAKWYIEEYEKRNGANPILIELAKLDFDMSQAIHLEDLKHTSRYRFSLLLKKGGLHISPR